MAWTTTTGLTIELIVRDADAEETITIRFCNTYAQCAEFAETLFVDGYTIEERPDLNSYAHNMC
jgi:hypothetical protein